MRLVDVSDHTATRYTYSKRIQTYRINHYMFILAIDDVGIPDLSDRLSPS